MSHSGPNVLVCFLVSKSPSVMSYSVTTGVLNRAQSLLQVTHSSPDLSYVWFSMSAGLGMGCMDLQGFVNDSQRVHAYFLFFCISGHNHKPTLSNKVIIFRGPSTKVNSDVICSISGKLESSMEIIWMNTNIQIMFTSINSKHTVFVNRDFICTDNIVSWKQGRFLLSPSCS